MTDKLKLRLTVEIEYEPNGISANTLKHFLLSLPAIGWREGVFTQDTNAECTIMMQRVDEIEELLR